MKHTAIGVVQLHDVRQTEEEGHSIRNEVLGLSTAELRKELVKVLAECILPVWDQAVHEG